MTTFTEFVETVSVELNLTDEDGLVCMDLSIDPALGEEYPDFIFQDSEPRISGSYKKGLWAVRVYQYPSECGETFEQACNAALTEHTRFQEDYEAAIAAARNCH